MASVASISAINQVSNTAPNLFSDYWQKFVELSELPVFPQILSFLNITLIFLTALVAFLSWRAARKANELQLLPLLAIYFKGKPMRDRKIRIRNIGKSPAYEIKIESYANIITDAKRVWRLNLSLSGTNVLVPNEEKNLTLIATDNGKTADMGDFMVFHLDPEEGHKRDRIELLMTFRNAEGNCYYCKVETGPGGLFVKPARRLDSWGKLYLNYRKYVEVVLLAWYRFMWKYTK